MMRTVTSEPAVRSGAATAWAQARNVLCIRLDSLGDVLMATPAMRALKQPLDQSHQGRRLTLLTSPAGAAIASLVPDLDEVIAYDAPWIKSTAARMDSRPEQQLATWLSGLHFDAAVILTTYSQSPLPAAFLCYLAEIPLRLAHCHENPYQLLSHWVPDSEPASGIRHEVRRQLDLVEAVGYRTDDERLSLAIPDAARRHIQGMLARRGIGGGPWAVIHPGATAASRRYPPELYAAAARTLVLEHGWQIIFTGDNGERALVEGICEQMQAPSHSLAGELTLPQLAALLSASPLVITNNTGPAHIAAAVGTPVVDLYALTNPQHTPWMVPARVLSHDVPCRNCYKSVCPMGHHQCLRGVSPAMVVAAALDLARECAATVASHYPSQVPAMATSGEH